MQLRRQPGRKLPAYMSPTKPSPPKAARTTGSSAGSAGAAIRAYGNQSRPGGTMGRGDELKCVDVNNVTVGLSSTAVFTPTNIPVQGAAFYNRVGRKINMKSLKLNLLIVPLRTITVSDFVRIMVLYDRQPNGALPASLATVLTSYNTAGTTSSTILDSLNQGSRDRFIVLADIRNALPSITVTAGVVTNVGVSDQVDTILNIQRFIPLKGLETVFNQTNGGSIGDIVTGSLLVFTAGTNTAGTEGYQAFLTTRLRYYD